MSESKNTPAVPFNLDDNEMVERMNLAERVQHMVLVFSFLLLIITGIPLLFFSWKPMQLGFSNPFAYFFRGIMHRFAATVLIGLSAFHFFYSVLTRNGRQYIKDMFPQWKDATDAFETFMHNIGFTRYLERRGLGKDFFARNPYWLFTELPRLGRFDFRNKFEYWAVVWGTSVMILTGFFMWAVTFTLSHFPLWFYDVCRVIHSYEAILAFLAIIVWHMYNVHLNPDFFPMSKTWINGKISLKHLRLHHPLEYEALLKKRQLLQGGITNSTPPSSKKTG